MVIFIIKKNMKKIIRLTESDLTRIIKRVINEQSNVGGSIFSNVTNLIKTANVGNWWNKSAILTELKKIKSCEDYSSFLDGVKKRGYKYGSDWIKGTLKTNPSRDKTQSADQTNPLKGLKTGLTDEEFNSQVNKLLMSWGGKCSPKK
jgi:hypothetical protein